MRENSQRWNTVTPTSFKHEERGLKLLAEVLPDAGPYRVWTNFRFVDSQGQWHEVDALVVGRRQIHLVELKDFSGAIAGNEHSWTHFTRTGEKIEKKNPVRLASLKAQFLASRLDETIQSILEENPELTDQLSFSERRRPWVKACVFLTNPGLNCMLESIGRQNVFGPDGDNPGNRIDGLEGIGSRLLEAPDDRQRITEASSSLLIEPAMNRIANHSSAEKTIGQWVLEDTLDQYDNVEIVAAHKKNNEKERALLRCVSVPENMSPDAAKNEQAVQQREYIRIRNLKHQNIDTPIDFFFENDRIVMVFPRSGHNWAQLDTLTKLEELTVDQKLEIITQVADALDFVHQRNIVHRNLGPDDILIDLDALAKGSIRVMVSGWTALASQNSASESQTASMTVVVSGSTLVHNSYDGFLPPEGFVPSSNQRLGDLFSLGAIAYLVLSNGQSPAYSRSMMLKVLNEHGGFDLAATGVSVDPGVRSLIKGVTSAQPKMRLAAVRKPKSSKDPANPIRAFIEALHGNSSGSVGETTDPYNPSLNATIADRFRVVKVLGTGSTARGILVDDLSIVDLDENHDSHRVLKVAASPEMNPRLLAEADSIKKLHENLPKDTNPQDFVQLLADPILVPGDRYALLLSNCGERNLSEAISLGMPIPQLFWSAGLQLLDRVVALEAAGVDHRDIKPANLGLQGSGKNTRITLFDFSLSHEPAEAIEAGTGDYRDPFLGASGKRRRFDSFAERYSAVVVLFNMATLTLPRYSEDATLPSFTDGKLIVSAADFEDLTPLSEQQVALKEFFERNLDGDTSQRAQTAVELRDQFIAIKKLNGSSVPVVQPKPSKPEPVLVTSTPENPVPIVSVEQLVMELRENSGTKDSSLRKLVSRVLGVAAAAPEDAFALNARYALSMKVTLAKVAELSAEVHSVWYKNKSLTSVYNSLVSALNDVIVSNGGIATPPLLTDAVSRLLSADESSHTSRQLEGIVRMIQLSLDKDPHQNKKFELLRRSNSHTVLALTNDPKFRAVPIALEAAVRNALNANPRGIVDAGELRNMLAETAADALDVALADMPISSVVLPELATRASLYAALTASGDAYSVNMSALQLVKAVFPQNAKMVSRGDLQDFISVRFPQVALKELPKHPELDKIIELLDPELTYDARRHLYARPEIDASSDIETKLPTSTATFTYRAQHYDALADQLRPTLRDRGFRVVSTALGSTGKTVESLSQIFDAAVVDVTAGVFAELTALVSDPAKLQDILNSDVPSERKKLGQILRAFSERVIDNAVRMPHEAVILTDVSILASYGNLDLLGQYSNISDNQNPRAIWVVVPEEENASETGILIEGEEFALSSPDQVVKA